MLIKIEYPCGYKIEIIGSWFDFISGETERKLFGGCPLHGLSCKPTSKSIRRP